MPTIIEATLDPETTEAEDFLSDIAGMLERIAEAAGLAIAVETSTASGRSWRVIDHDEASAALLPEVGIHRGQLARGPAGRIRTYKVGVAIRPSRAQTPSDSIIRTYSYPLQRVSFHRSGTQHALADVLAATVRDPGEPGAPPPMSA